MPASPSHALPIRLTNGINTKDDELLQVKMLALENATFQRPGGYRKRYGMSQIALPSALVRKLAVYNNELLAIADDGLFSRIAGPSGGWTGSKGFPALSRTSETTVSSDFQNNTTNGGSDNRGMVFGDIAVAGGYAFAAWIEYNTGQNQCYVTVYDIATGAQRISRAQLAGTSQAKNCRWFLNAAGTTMSLYVQGNTTTFGRFDFSVATPAVPAIVATTFTDNPIGAFDVTSNGTTGALVQAQSTGLKNLRFFTGNPPAPTQNGGTLITTGAQQIVQLHIHAGSDGNFWVAWGESDGAATSTIHVLAVNPAGTSVATPITVATLTNSTLPVNVGVIYSAAIGGPIVFWEDDLTGSEAKRLQHRMYSLSGATLTALAAAQLTMLWGAMISRPVLLSGVPYVWVANMSLPVNGIPFYASAFLLRIDTTDLSALPKARVVAKALHRAAPSRLNNQTTFVDTPSQVALDGADILILAPKLIGTSGAFAQNAAYAPTVIRTSLKQAVDTALLTKSLTLGASLIQSYDGAQLVELNHLAPPEQVTAATTATGGALSNGTYLYAAVYEWVDANGEIQQSLPSSIGSITISGGGSVQQLQLSCRAPLLTAKQGIVVRFYVSLSTQQTLFASAVGDASLSGIFGSLTTGLITLNVSSIGTAPLYSQSALSNDAPQPTNFLARVSDRLWGHAGQGVLEFTKTRIVTHAAEFSGLLTQQLSSFLLPNAMAELSGNRQVVFADEALAEFDGDGPDNTGSGVFNDDELISRSIGCQAQRNLVRWDGGVLFSSKKGWYNLDDGLGLQYVGADIEAYNGLTPAGVAYDPVSNRIKAALQGVGSPILVFDTYTQTWSVETNSFGINAQSIVFWRDQMQLLDIANNVVWSQTPGLYTDSGAAIIMRERTGWFAPADLLGFFYVKKIEILGEKKSDHNLIVNLRYNYSEAIASTTTIPCDPSIAIGPYQWGITPKQQQAFALSIEIYDDFTGFTPGEGYALEGIALELGFENGLFPLTAAQTVRET